MPFESLVASWGKEKNCGRKPSTNAPSRKVVLGRNFPTVFAYSERFCSRYWLISFGKYPEAVEFIREMPRFSKFSLSCKIDGYMTLHRNSISIGLKYSCHCSSCLPFTVVANPGEELSIEGWGFKGLFWKSSRVPVVPLASLPSKKCQLSPLKISEMPRWGCWNKKSHNKNRILLNLLPRKMFQQLSQDER